MPKQLLSLANEAASNAYAPYSKFHVGAAALFEDGSIYKGCNVENSSYGLTLCAERNAISSAIASGNRSKLLAIAISSPNTKLCYPCGGCRQWIAEFSDNCQIILEDSDGEVKTHTISELLPHSFNL